MRLARALDRPRGRRRCLALAAVALVRRGAVAPPTVRTAAAHAAAPGGAGSVLDASGYVTARRQATVSAKITGKVTEVLIEEGMRVKEGDGAGPARRHRGQGRSSRWPRRSSPPRARSSPRSAPMLAQAERDYARQQELLRRQLVSRAGAGRRARPARHAAGPARPALEEQVRVAQESVARRRRCSSTTPSIRAPFAGVVIAKSAQPGEMISPISAGGGFTRTGIGTIVDMDSLEIQVDVNESFINRVTPGPARRGDAERLSGLEDPRRGHRHHPDGRPQQGHREGAHRAQGEGFAHRARHGRARGLPRAPRRPGAGTAPEPGVLVPAEAVRGEAAAGVVFVVRRRARSSGARVTLGPAVGADRQVLSGRARRRARGAGAARVAQGRRRVKLPRRLAETS